jgi:hypothetical protein
MLRIRNARTLIIFILAMVLVVVWVPEVGRVTQSPTIRFWAKTRDDGLGVWRGGGGRGLSFMSVPAAF